MRLIPKRGYFLLATGLVLGFLLNVILTGIYGFRGGSRQVVGLPERVEIVFLYSSEKSSWLEEVTPLFEKWFKEKYGFEVRVKLIAAGTHETINMIMQGSVRPTIWSPASSIWVPYFNYRWKKKYGKDIAKEWVPLVISPIVIAGWKSLAEKYHVTCFRDLYELSEQGVDYKWGHPDPLLSNGGTMTVLLEFAEAAGKPLSELTVEDLLNETVLEIVRTIESHAVFYGKSTGFFGTWAADNGPDAITFFGVYENIVIDNAIRAERKWGDRLVAIYPEYGTLLSDHPFIILDADWVDYWQKFAASQYLLFLLQPEIQKRAMKHGFRPANPLVPLDSTIFCEENGVSYEIPVKVMEPPPGEVLEALFKVWEKVKNPGAG
ncbi:MAG TPA: ABC transporter substrate-binding protein [Thermoprotei archaeon]|nr:MAG: hypothetical protein DRJ63_02985 [Thermoprotei archaeon]HDI75333.1 ABC transporter substrate-binding protein [Thermoprotei archaeon]